MTESEATAIRFTIDHYEPRSARPDLEKTYDNLMYACDECNLRKGDRTPPDTARVNGYRFFRPDQDIYSDHFEKNDRRLNSKTNVGYFSIEALDLNRLSLRRLREIRQRLTKCDRFVVEGILALRNFHIDQLPPSIKAKAVRAIHQVNTLAETLASDIDDVLRDYAQSTLIDDDVDLEAEVTERMSKLRDIEALHPGVWRGRRATPGAKT